MMKIIKWFAVLLVLSAAELKGQVLVTNFGSNAINGGSWSYDESTSTISGTEGFGDLLFGAPLNADFLGNTSIRLEGNVTVAPAGVFMIRLEDESFNQAYAFFNWADFLAGPQLIELALNYTTFDFSNVVGWSLEGQGSLQSVNATFTSLSAVPEPATTGLMLAGLALFVLGCRLSAFHCKPSRL